MTHLERAKMESHLARAHRAIWAAKNSAERLNDHSVYLDLQQIEVELVRIAEGSLRGAATRQIVGQLRLAPGSRGSA